MNNNYATNEVPHTIGSIAIAFMAAQIISTAPMPIDLQQKGLNMASIRQTTYQSSATNSDFNQLCNTGTIQYFQGMEPLDAAISDFYTSLLASQESLGAEFAKVLYENLWELYES